MAGGGSWKLPEPRRAGPPFFTRSQVASVLHQVGVLLELQGANPFRIRSYANGSRMLGSLTADLGELVASGELIEVKGIGKGLAGGISQAVEQGVWPEDWVALHEGTPAGLIEMLGIPNLGPKRIKQLHEELGLDDVEALQGAAESGEIAPLDGFGEKSQSKILSGIELLKRFNARRRLDIGMRYGQAFEEKIAALEGVEKATLAGSTRRRLETIGDLDIVVAVEAENHDDVAQAILGLSGIADVKGAGDSKISLILDTSLFDEGFTLGHIDANVLEAIGGEAYEQLESSGTIDAQVRLVSPRAFPYTLAYFTGSKEHNIRLRQRAIERGLRLNEFGLIPEAEAGDLKGQEAAKFSLPAKDEAEIYAHLDLAWVPPALREDMGEVEAAEIGGTGLPDLVCMNSIHGALHNHTVLSDGQATLEQMAEAAIRLGWDWLGISDHSQSLRIANGAIAEDLLAQGRKISTYNAQWAEQGINFRLFHGVESDILEGGKLDYSDEVLGQLDHVIASVHAITKWSNRDEMTNTEELIKCLEHPATTILGHPTGRILQGRDGFPVDMHAVLRAMAELRADGQVKFVELNASPYRLDLDWRLCKYAKELAIPVSINPDAHSVGGLADIHYGVEVARKGWLSSEDVVNYMRAEQLGEVLN